MVVGDDSGPGEVSVTVVDSTSEGSGGQVVGALTERVRGLVDGAGSMGLVAALAVAWMVWGR